MKINYIVDSQFQKVVDNYSWYQRSRPAPFYFFRYIKEITGKRTQQYLHHFILSNIGIIIPENFQVDHVNRNELDNRSVNLRLVTMQVNGFNRPHKCYYFDKSIKKFRCSMEINHKHVDFGYCASEEDAQALVKEKRNFYYQQALKSSNLLLRKSLEEMGEDPERPFLLLNQSEDVLTFPFIEKVKIGGPQ